MLDITSFVFTPEMEFEIKCIAYCETVLHLMFSACLLHILSNVCHHAIQCMCILYSCCTDCTLAACRRFCRKPLVVIISAACQEIHRLQQRNAINISVSYKLSDGDY